MLSHWIRGHITNAVQSLCEDLDVVDAKEPIVKIEQPASLEHGDYSSNIAMQLAKALRQPPLQIAELIKAELLQQGNMQNLLSRIEIVPPGFINLYINWEAWMQQEFELPKCSAEKIVIEHTSINPNKSAHIGHLRNSCIGDTLVRLLRRVGYDVEVHNYIDDLGNQLADTVVGLLHIPLSGEHGRFGDYCWDLYAMTNKAYAIHPELAEKRIEVLHDLECGNSNISWVGMLAAERIVREHLEDMSAFGIQYDLLVWESSIVREGFWHSAFQRLQKTSLFYQETEGKLAGCWVLKQSAEDQVQVSMQKAATDHAADKVLVRSNGILTYTAKDIAYHLWKYGLLDKDFAYQKFSGDLWITRSYGIAEKSFGHADSVINVIDYRQEYPQAMVKQALQALGYAKEAENLYHVSYGVVSLSPSSAAELGIDISDGKSSYAMSGRQGIGIKVTELLDIMEGVIENKRTEQSGLSSREIAAAAIRYYLLRFSLQTEVVFDLEQATEISGNTGVYLLYAYARANNVLRKAQERNLQPNRIPVKIISLEPAERALLRHISSWFDTLHNASKELTPNTICSYAYQLAALFNNFYTSCPVLKAESALQPFRIWLTAKAQETLGDALQVLGLPAPSRM
ncbi:arginine--tRNA ligase [Paenibacillus woosongensis]|uniref:Arginine--tRNA ligase n=1 Tax=Paenibacillus woosongensis TaxID=307580 RepID=A0A7X2Z1X5_9BACL|nr:arginine--tRNA ligase [Paenibacillus woosongensis]MUG46089.1 arginine--tRNA ligase [Paenibacillus woosongensis]